MKPLATAALMIGAAALFLFSISQSDKKKKVSNETCPLTDLVFGGFVGDEECMQRECGDDVDNPGIFSGGVRL